jgi:hypothetical protein
MNHSPNNGNNVFNLGGRSSNFEERLTERKSDKGRIFKIYDAEIYSIFTRFILVNDGNERKDYYATEDEGKCNKLSS